MSDLFAEPGRFESIPMKGGTVALMRNFPIGDLQTPLTALIAESNWRQEEISVWGKRHLQPRLTAWYGDAGRSYSYSGVKLDPMPWTPLLLDLRKCVEGATNSKFNSVLLNLYRDQNDAMGFHSDDEPDLGKNPTIASLSFGAERVFVMKPRQGEGAPIRIPLPSGSLLLMSGETQRNWLHGIARESRPCGPRVNLTFRNILS